MKSAVRSDETLHLLRIEIGITTGVQLIHQYENAVRQLLKALHILSGKLLACDLRNNVDLKRLAELIKVHDVFACQPHYFCPAIRGLLQQALGDELANGLAHWCSAAPKFLRKQKL